MARAARDRWQYCAELGIFPLQSKKCLFLEYLELFYFDNVTDFFQLMQVPGKQQAGGTMVWGDKTLGEL